MKIISVRAFDGRNIYAHRKCIRMDVDLEGYSEIPSKDIDEFNYNLIKLLPELNKHRCGIYESGGFVTRLKEGTYIAHICEHIIIALQNIIGIEVSYGKARVIEGEKYYIIYEYKYKESAIKIGKLAVDIVNGLINKKEIKFDERIKEIKENLSSEYIGPSTEAICTEAIKRNIPVVKIDEGLFQLGLGKYGRLIEATISENTRAISVDIACDKILSKNLLKLHGIPIPRGRIVKNAIELLFYAEEIGYPIVIKPQCGNQGKGVIVNIRNEKEAFKAYDKLSKLYQDIIVEKYIEGNDYRVCVVDDKVVAVALRMPPAVIGDGKSSIKQLIECINEDPRRGNDHEKPLTMVKVDEELLNEIGKRGYTLYSILPKNEKLVLRGNANLSTGGSAIDCTDNICTENIDICIRAAKALGLDICGIDICCEDISKPINKQGAIIELNAAPGIRMHHYPITGESRNVAGAIVDMMFKDIPKSIPIVSITGTNGKTTTTRLIAHTLALKGYNVGMTTTGGIFIGDKCIEAGDTTGPESAMTVLINRDVDAAVLETARGGMIRGGLAYDLADVGVITNITDDHLGVDGIDTLEDLADVKSLVVEAVKDEGYAVINADDTMSLNIIDRIKSKLIMFSKDKNNEVLRKNVETGGIAVYTFGGCICMEDKDTIVKIVDINDIGITFNGKLVYNIENSMAACAALVGLGVDCFTIRKGLSTFYCNEFQNPGRFNMYTLNGVTVILDYGHNIEGYRAVMHGITQLKHNRLIGVIGVPGDRLDSNIIDVGKISSKYLDYIYIKEDKDKRGRKSGEVASLLEKGVIYTGFNKKNMEIILDEAEAFNKALDNAKYGDIVIIFFEKFEPLLNIVKEKKLSIDKIKEVMA